MWTIFKVFIEFGTALLLFYGGIFVVCLFVPETCGTLDPQSRIKLAPPALDNEVLITGSPRKIL